MALSKQMELFEDGGLKDEGGMIDEVSGNDVPSGSTREEVRDDIPAQLSEGEFVFPADVVRYIGLEKLMMMRQEAKQGLKQMEAMGQMGNSDEATMPDDLPFDETDLDMEDDLEYNEGGVVQAQRGTYVAPTVPTGSQPLGTTPMGAPPIPQQVGAGVSGTAFGTPYTPNVGKMYGAGATPYAPVTYTELLGPSAAGAPQTKNVRYVNEATNQTRMIPHLLNADGTIGDTLYPVPQGFVRQDEAPKEEAKKTQVQTAKVETLDTGDGDGDSDVSTLGGARMDVGGKSFAIGYNFDGSITLTDPNTMESKNYDKNSQITKDAKAVTAGQLVDLAKLTPAGVTTAVVQAGLEKIGVTLPGGTKVKDIQKKSKEAKKRLSETLAGISTDPTEGLNLEDLTAIQSGLEGKEVDKEEMQRLADKVKDIVDKQSYNLGIGSESSALGGPTAASYSTPSAVASASSFGDDNSSDDSSSGGDSGMDASSGVSDDGGGWTATGGFINKKKMIMHKGPPKAKKRMKRGGLASR